MGRQAEATTMLGASPAPWIGHVDRLSAPHDGRCAALSRWVADGLTRNNNLGLGVLRVVWPHCSPFKGTDLSTRFRPGEDDLRAGAPPYLATATAASPAAHLMSKPSRAPGLSGDARRPSCPSQTGAGRADASIGGRAFAANAARAARRGYLCQVDRTIRGKSCARTGRWTCRDTLTALSAANPAHAAMTTAACSRCRHHSHAQTTPPCRLSERIGMRPRPHRCGRATGTPGTPAPPAEARSGDARASPFAAHAIGTFPDCDARPAASVRRVSCDWRADPRQRGSSSGGLAAV